METIAENKKAFYDYFIEDKFEAGIALVGSEVKSIRDGKVNLKDTYVQIKNGEAFVINMFISDYDKNTLVPLDTRRSRKLLLHKNEISKLERKVKILNYSIVPTKLYFKNRNVKIEIALAKGKKLYDKRQAIAERDVAREGEREKLRLE